MAGTGLSFRQLATVTLFVWVATIALRALAPKAGIGGLTKASKRV